MKIPFVLYSNSKMDEWKDGWTDRWMDGHTDGRMDGSASHHELVTWMT